MLCSQCDVGIVSVVCVCVICIVVFKDEALGTEGRTINQRAEYRGSPGVGRLT